MAFYDIFDYLCKQKGISPTGVARENGISQQTVSQWKKRGSTPNAQTVNKLADYFNIPVEHLLAFSSKKEIDRIDDMAARVSKLSGIPKEEIMELV